VSKKQQKAAAPEDEDAPKGGKKKLLLIGLVAVLALAAAAYFFVFSSGSAEAEPAAEPGETVLSIDPVAINLAGGSYLKLGIALQFSAEFDAGGHEGDPDGSKALDLAISQFSGAALSDVQTNREAMKAALQQAVVAAYDGDVMSIYYTEYVTQ
jgi:flagellar protein FliL